MCKTVQQWWLLISTYRVFKKFSSPPVTFERLHLAKWNFYSVPRSIGTTFGHTQNLGAAPPGCWADPNSKFSNSNPHFLWHFQKEDKKRKFLSYCEDLYDFFSPRYSRSKFKIGLFPKNRVRRPKNPRQPNLCFKCSELHALSRKIGNFDSEGRRPPPPATPRAALPPPPSSNFGTFAPNQMKFRQCW